jgi:hypothetical protein
MCLGLPFINYGRARACWWDLILFADHASADAFHPRIIKIQVYHSLGSGKIIGGEHYRYGCRAFLENGRPHFTKMFEASETIRQRAIAAKPKLTDVIVTVGDLKVDAMLSLQTQRDEIRQSMNLAPADTVVLIQSTWGDTSLMETMGVDLIEEAKKLMEKGAYRFILSTHPIHWKSAYARQHPWGQYIESKQEEGFLVIRPGQDFEPYHVAADIAVTDHTGLCLNFALLHKPMVFVSIPDGTVLPDSWEAQLKVLSPTLEAPTALDQTLQNALTDYPVDELRALSLKIDSCPGTAAEGIREEIYGGLGISPPTSPGYAIEETQVGQRMGC